VGRKEEPGNRAWSKYTIEIVTFIYNITYTVMCNAINY